MFEELLKKIRENTFSDESLSITHAGLEEEDVTRLVEALNENRHIRKLDLSYNSIGNGGAAALLDLLVRPLDEIDLTASNIGPSGAERLSKLRIQTLKLSGNPIGKEGESFFADAVIVNLYLDECGITENGIALLLKNEHIRNLALSNNDISIDAVLAFPTEGCLLERLDLSQNNLFDESIAGIDNLKSLKFLDLGSNSLDGQSALAISKLSSLKTLILSQNKIKPDAVKIILQNSNIETLNLFNNKLFFSEDDRLPKNNSIVTMDLSRNRLDEKSHNVLKQLLENSALENLDLSGNQLGSSEMEMLTQYKNQSASLKRVSLIDNHPVSRKKRFVE